MLLFSLLAKEVSLIIPWVPLLKGEVLNIEREMVKIQM